MNISFRKATATSGSALLALMAGTALVAFPSAGVASAAPAKCNTQVSGSSGYISFTLHVNADSCHTPIRASADCVYSIPQDPPAEPYVYDEWAYGGVVTKAGTTSKASCGPAVYILEWGYDYQSNGWKYRNMGDH